MNLNALKSGYYQKSTIVDPILMKHFTTGLKSRSAELKSNYSVQKIPGHISNIIGDGNA